MDIVPQTDNTTNKSLIQEQKLGYVYRHIRLDTNEVFYIGKGTNTDGKYARAYSNKRANPHWHNVVNKRGHIVEIIIDNLTETDTNETEKSYILFYGRIDLGTGTLVNLTDGGDGALGYKHTKEAKEKIRCTSIGRKKTNECKERIGKAQIGKKLSSEAKEKLRQANLGRKDSKETIEKRRKATIGQKRTLEQRARMSDGQMGTKRTPEQLEKRYKPVGQYKDDILIKEYPSCKSVELNGYGRHNVSACCRNKRKSYKGFHWKFL